MNFKLGQFENKRIFYSPKGNKTFIRDVIIKQVIPSEPILEKENIKIEEVIKEEIFTDIVKEKNTLKNKISSKNKSKSNRK